MEENQNQNDEIRRLVAENLQLTKETHEMTRKIKNYVTFQKIMSVAYFLLFILPLILAIVYLPKFINDYIQPVQQLMNPGQPVNSLNNANDILQQVQNVINDGNKGNNQ